MRRTIECLVLPFLIGLVPNAARAADQEKPETVFEREKNETNKDLYSVNIAVPTATALSVVGAKDVSAIGADIAPDFFSQFTPKDKGVPEIAISARPYWLLNPGKRVQDYQDDRKTSRGERILARTRISLASANNAEGEGFALGAGLNTMLTGGSDPRSDALFLRCVQTAGEKFTDQLVSGGAIGAAERQKAVILLQAQPTYLNAAPDVRSTAEKPLSQATSAFEMKMAFAQALGVLGINDLDAINAIQAQWEGSIASAEIKFDKADYDACVKKATTRYQARPAWAVGAGSAYRAETRDFDKLRYAGVSVWSTFKIPLFGASKEEGDKIRAAEAAVKDEKAKGLAPTANDSAQDPAEGDKWKGSFQLSARYVSHDKVTVAGAAERAATFIGAGQFQASRGALELSTTVAYTDNDFAKVALASDRYTRYSATAKVPLAQGLAMELSGGTTSGRAHKEDSFAIFRLTATGKALKAIGGLKTLMGD